MTIKNLNQFWKSLYLEIGKKQDRQKANTVQGIPSNVWLHRHIPSDSNIKYRSGTVNSKSFVGKVLLRIKWKFELN